ncbi:uncharacterized protein J3R85_018419 [Psidium guajava]|nr:uncharacterized protein J3R85_018419 [Psidium guajava]
MANGTRDPHPWRLQPSQPGRRFDELTPPWPRAVSSSSTTMAAVSRGLELRDKGQRRRRPRTHGSWTPWRRSSTVVAASSSVTEDGEDVGKQRDRIHRR